MKAEAVAIPGPMLLTPHVFTDQRGSFFESFNAESFAQLTGERRAFAQDNQSSSARGVVRGLHYQLPPAAQGKLVRVLSGTIFDVAVDIRRSSPNFGRWVGLELSAERACQLWVPEGFAHGFMALSDVAVVSYKVTTPWARDAERAIRWDDPDLAISWPQAAAPALLSPKDAEAPLFAMAETFP